MPLRKSETSIKTMASIISISLILNEGTRKKPAKNTPEIPPAVEIAYRFPTVEPLFAIDLSLILTAKGDTIPSRTEGTINNTTEEERETK